jgi:SAM-dependent methyltransferase
VREGNSGPLHFGDLVAFYERAVDPLTLPMGRRALALVELSHGNSLIDVAAGTGALAAEAAALGAHVLATDMEPNMVARAAARLASFPGSEARVMDFDALNVPDASFDVAVSIVGVLAFPGAHSGILEMVRVTRPGGRVAVANWDQERGAAPQYLARDVFASLFPRQQLWPADFFPDWPGEAATAALCAAGCSSAELHYVEAEWVVESPANVMEDNGASIRMLPGYRALNAVERQYFEDAFTEAVLDHAGRDGVARIATRGFVAIGHLPV